MVRMKKSSGLLGKSLKKHAGDETSYEPDYSKLPGDITGGIAKLVEAKIGIYQKGDNKGEKFVFLSGTVVEPKTAVNTVLLWKNGEVVTVSNDEISIRGLFTSQTLPLCDVTRKDGDVVSLDENVDRALNELRKLGGEESTSDIGSEEDLQDILQSLKEAGIFFRFNTSLSAPTAQYPNARVWENWRGACEYVESEEDDSVDDNTVDEPEEEESKEEDASKLDLSALASNADAGDESCQLKLDELATAAGIDSDSYDDWQGVAAALSEEAEDDAEVDFSPPKKGEVLSYKPPRARKLVECEVTAVFPGKGTCNLKSLDEGKSFKGISWDSLVEEE